MVGVGGFQVTIVLIGLSWNAGYVLCGATVILIHNISDIFLQGAKLINYWDESSLAATFVFLGCVVTWAPLRLFHYYPVLVYHAWASVTGRGLELPVATFILESLLTVLYPLHLYWFYLMLIVMKNAVSGVQKDIREDDAEVEQVVKKTKKHD